MIPVNLTAVFVAAVASMAVGFVWYSKAAFGNRWMKLTGRSEETMDKSGMMRVYILMFVVSLVMGYILSIFIHYAGARDLILGAKTGLWAWIGFVVPATLANHLFRKQPFELYAVEAGHHLANLLVMGAILGAWF